MSYLVSSPDTKDVKQWGEPWPAGHVPLQRWVLGVPLALCWCASFDSLLLRLELLPLRCSDGDGLEVDLVLTILHLRARVTQDAEVQCTSGEERRRRTREGEGNLVESLHKSCSWDLDLLESVSCWQHSGGGSAASFSEQVYGTVQVN